MPTKIIIDEKANWNEMVKKVEEKADWDNMLKKVEAVKQKEIDFEIKILKVNAELFKKQEQIRLLLLEIQDITDNLTKLYLHGMKNDK
tara:strand:- start:4956 stop:5219 length:264 start_codon:yes stop_codon:yes gene_type:complete